MSWTQEVRRWVAADLGRVGFVHSLSRQHAYDALVPAEALALVTPEQQARVWTERFANLPEQHAALVVEHDREVVGFALAQLQTKSGAELMAIHVLPERHGTGAGQALMDAVLDAFRTWGVAEARLHVVDGNERAQSFYRRNGWWLHGTAGTHEIGGAAVPILEYRRAFGGAR